MPVEHRTHQPTPGTTVPNHPPGPDPNLGNLAKAFPTRAGWFPAARDAGGSPGTPDMGRMGSPPTGKSKPGIILGRDRVKVGEGGSPPGTWLHVSRGAQPAEATQGKHWRNLPRVKRDAAWREISVCIQGAKVSPRAAWEPGLPLRSNFLLWEEPGHKKYLIGPCPSTLALRWQLKGIRAKSSRSF